MPHITDKFEGHSFNRYKDAMLMTLKKCRNIYDSMYLLYSYFNTCKVGLINRTLHHARYVQYQSGDKSLGRMKGDKFVNKMTDFVPPGSRVLVNLIIQKRS